jgi:hypothetical protein
MRSFMRAKRQPGAGRKPRGPFSQNSAVMTVRMPDDLRAELERSANKKGWSLSQELLWRVRSSYKRQREEERRSPATRALCFLLSELAERVGLPNIAEWHRSPFAFRAFRLALAQVLERLEPAGAIKSPGGYKRLTDAFRTHIAPKRWAECTKTPETFADFLSKRLMIEIMHPDPLWESALREELRDHPVVGPHVRGLLDHIYSIADVRRDLGVPASEPKALVL